MLKKNRAAIRIPASAVLNSDDRKKFSVFVALLVQVNKRINPDEYAVPAKARAKKKTKECDLEKLHKEGSQNRGPCLLFIIHTLSCIFDYFKICSIGKAYD